jgi:NAD(P)-dependent dehydrogenase (short-subunit alcohol dehydrogenase family)
MTKKLESKVALITGGSSGIGLATAKRFIAEGAEVVIAARRQEQLDAAAQELGHHAMAVKADVSKLTDLDELMDQVGQRHGRLDIVFANAGGGGGGGPRPMQQLTEQNYYGVFDQNVKTVLFTVQKSLSLLTDGGAIVLTTSIANAKGLPGASAYGAAKAAVRSLARSWTTELKGRGIRVNAVSPGPVDTPLHANAGKDNPNAAKMIAGLTALIPVGRIGRPDEIASAVTFLASEEASFITGVELCVDGGMTEV